MHEALSCNAGQGPQGQNPQCQGHPSISLIFIATYYIMSMLTMSKRHLANRPLTWNVSWSSLNKRTRKRTRVV